MKKLILFAVSLAALTGSTHAADLPTQKVPPVAAAPAPIWSGFYAGLNAGGTWANNSSLNVSTWPVGVGHPTGAALWTGSVPTGSSAGFIGGGQIGFNWQANLRGLGFVTGVEADIQGIAGDSSSSSAIVSAAPLDGGMLTSTMRGNSSLSYIGTVRGRVGYLAMPNLLVYGTGGLAYGGVNASLSLFQLNGGIPGAWGGGTSNYSSTQVGWTAGGGVEYMFLPNWSAKAEYLYYDLGSMASNAVSYHFTPGRPAGIADVSNVSTRFNGNIVRAGINYHLNFGAAPVIAKY